MRLSGSKNGRRPRPDAFSGPIPGGETASMAKRTSTAMITISRAEKRDAEAILALQKLAYRSEAALYDDWSIPPLVQSIESLLEEFGSLLILKAESERRIIGSVRARLADGVCVIGRLAVHPDFQGAGIGSHLLRAIEARFPDASRYELFTGSRSEANIRLYQRHGFAVCRTEALSPQVSLIFLEKPGKAMD
jgi:ribosomal protein S18 acetylase RimI-like enzyme